MTTHKPALLGQTLPQLQDIVRKLGLPAFTAKQIAQWIYQKRVKTIDEMTNLGKKAREALAAEYEVGLYAPVEQQCSADGTIKYLYQTQRGDYVESVYIPEANRATLCVSSQVGCKMRCTFCMTGRQGFAAQLSATDILNQALALPEAEKLTNIVFMGQGEPCDNIDAVLQATHILTANYAWAWSPKRITISTVGIRQGITRLLQESDCSIAISLHAPDHEGRLALMPAEQAMPIDALVQYLRQYDFCTRPTHGQVRETSRQRRLSFEYILFEGINDSMKHAQALIDLLRGLDCRINLIRFHPIPDAPFRGVDEERMLAFRNYLTAHGLFTTIRASRGQDIFAACGLLSTAKQQQDKKLARTMQVTGMDIHTT